MQEDLVVEETQPGLIIYDGDVQEVPVESPTNEESQGDANGENAGQETSVDGQQAGKEEQHTAEESGGVEAGNLPDESADTVTLESVQASLDAILKEMQESNAEPVETVTYTKELKTITKAMNAQYDLNLILLVAVGLVFGALLATMFWKRFS